jgi:hypothetical protein
MQALDLIDDSLQHSIQVSAERLIAEVQEVHL